VKTPIRVEAAPTVFGTQMELTLLTPHTVSFAGPALGRRARGALSAAGISVLERRPSTDWGPQQQEFLVTLEARDAADAIRRVELALQRQGTYKNFFANLR
jgi:hypothetical protein